MIHDALSTIYRTLHLTVQGKCNGIQQRGFAAACGTEDAEQSGLTQLREIDLLRLTIALQT
ncbi:hypothetical protein D3C80_1562550 [compost metagenome]